MSQFSPVLRHLIVLAAGVLLSWLLTDVVPFLSGQTGYGLLLAGLISSAVAYFTPLVQAYGVGRKVAAEVHPSEPVA